MFLTKEKEANRLPYQICDNEIITATKNVTTARNIVTNPTNM